MEAIKFPDVEALLVTHLRAVLSTQNVGTKVPKDRPSTFLKVTRVGGTKVRINAESAMVTFQAWGVTKEEAHDLAALARAYVHAMAGTTVSGTWIYRVVEVGGPAFVPDLDTATPRYQFTVSLDVKGVTVS